jgi:uncharacterized sodium:solute symporter family permease YidK
MKKLYSLLECREMSDGNRIMNAIFIVGALLIALGIAFLSQTGLLTSSQMAYYPFVGTSLFIIGIVLCYLEFTSSRSKNLRLDTDSPSVS